MLPLSAAALRLPGFVILPLVSLTVIATTPSARAAEATPAAAPEQLVADGPALLREWEPPIYPAEELKARRGGMVNVMLIIDDAGRVTSARALEDSDEAFIASAIAAVKGWVFAPEIEDGKLVACCMETLVTFSPTDGQRKSTKGKFPPQDQTFRRAQRKMPQRRHQASCSIGSTRPKQKRRCRPWHSCARKTSP